MIGYRHTFKVRIIIIIEGIGVVFMFYSFKIKHFELKLN
jgi:ribosomal protein L19